MKDEVDASYFDSYSGFNIHCEMISDKVGVRLGMSVVVGVNGC